MASASRRSRRLDPLLAYDAIVVEESLIQPDMIAAIATQEAKEQTEASYGLDRKERLRDVIPSKFALAQLIHKRFSNSDKGKGPTERWLHGLIAQVFEFEDLQRLDPVTIDERVFPIGRQAKGGRVPVVFAPFGEMTRGDAAFGDQNRQRSPTQLLQEYLNAADHALWGIVTDGARLRLYRDNAALTRPAFIEADLTRIFDPEEPRLADFAALWLLIHQSRFGAASIPLGGAATSVAGTSTPAGGLGVQPTDCVLERWREDGRERGATARHELRNNVKVALELLGQGLLGHADNARLREDLEGGRLSPEDYLRALLRLVYRLIFVFTAEDRNLLHHPLTIDDDPLKAETPEERREAYRRARDVYAKGYSLARLRDRAVKRHLHDRHADAFEGIKILFRSLAKGEPMLALPALGGLFNAGGTRDFLDCSLDNRHLYGAIQKLAWLDTDAGMERINWRDMQTEELGSVYESLLELVPALEGTFELIDAKGNDRKTTASYYTPESLVQALLDQTLDPLIEEAVGDKSNEEAAKALLKLRIIDPACGSGHFLLAAARRIATRLTILKSNGAPSPDEFRHHLRDVAKKCLFGVDKNPLAVELARVALWIETVEPGKPLTFLDAHLCCGDSLFGIYKLEALLQGIPDEAYKPLTGDDKKAATFWKKKNQAEREATRRGEFDFFPMIRSLYDQARQVEEKPDNTLEELDAKEMAYRALHQRPEHRKLMRAAQLYIAAFLLPKMALQTKTAQPRDLEGELIHIPTTNDIWSALQHDQHSLGKYEGVFTETIEEAKPFQWPLAFLQVLANGGFSLVTGNPPWERIKLQEQEFFATRDPEITTAPNKAARQKRIDALKNAETGSGDRRLYDEFIQAKRTAEAASTFARTAADQGGRFPLTGRGDVNTYALFTEFFSTLAPRAGVIVPTGIATDATTASFFADLISQRRLAGLTDFENRERLFQAVDSRMKFVILALTSDVKESHFSFFLTNPAQIANDSRRFSLTPDEIQTINPNTRTAPVFRSQADAELTKQIYARVPVLIDEAKGEAGNPWGISFARLFDMSNDSKLFRTTHQMLDRVTGATGMGDDELWQVASDQGLLPLFEAKMIHQFDSAWAGYDRDGKTSHDTPPEHRADPAHRPLPRYWVEKAEVDARLKATGWIRDWVMGYRGITNATNERSVIGSAFPLAGVGNSLPLWLPSENIDPSCFSCLIAALSSLPLDYVARSKLGGTNLNFFIAEQFPVLPPQMFSNFDLNYILPRVIELTYTNHAMAPFARDLGYDGSPFPFDPERRAALRAELDAWIARLYGLGRDQLRYILDPAEICGPDYPSETFRVLKNKEIKTYGDYRTARLTLAAWDEQNSKAKVA